MVGQLGDDRGEVGGAGERPGGEATGADGRRTDRSQHGVAAQGRDPGAQGECHVQPAGQRQPGPPRASLPIAVHVVTVLPHGGAAILRSG